MLAYSYVLFVPLFTNLNKSVMFMAIGSIQLIIIIVVVVLLFLALRKVVLWYYKIDKLLENQINTELVLKDILAELQKNK